MKKITIPMLVLAGASMLGGAAVSAQDTPTRSAAAAPGSAEAFANQQFALLLKDIRSIKKQVIAANLTLTDGEATKFWPVYEQYSAEFGKINDARAALVKEYSDEYGTQTDEQADSLVRRWLDVDIAAAQLLCRELGLAVDLFDVEEPFGAAPLDLEQRSRVVAAGSEEVCRRIAAALAR